jgi:SPP1 family predicted phage head-tail adaptor
MRINEKPINPGELRTPITLKKRTVTTDAGGFKKEVYASAATVYARWQNAHGREVWTADMAGAIAPATLLIRYMAGIDESWVVDKNGEIFEIVSIDNIMERNEYLEIKVKRLKTG